MPWWSVKTRNSPTLPISSRPPWSAMVIGLIAAAGTMIPALMVAPAWPAGAELEPDVDVPELPHAARMPPSSGIDRPIALPLRMKSRRDSRPATNSSMTCSWTGPRPLRRSSSRSWSMLRPIPMNPPEELADARFMASVDKKQCTRRTRARQATGAVHRHSIMFIESQHSAAAMLLTLHILQLPQFVRRDVAAHEVTRLHLCERRFRGLAHAAGQPARAAGVEHASAGRV